MAQSDKPSGNDRVDRGLIRIISTGILLLVLVLFYVLGLNRIIPAEASAIGQFLALCVIVVVQVVLR